MYFQIKYILIHSRCTLFKFWI